MNDHDAPPEEHLNFFAGLLFTLAVTGAITAAILFWHAFT